MTFTLDANSYVTKDGGRATFIVAITWKGVGEYNNKINGNITTSVAAWSKVLLLQYTTLPMMGRSSWVLSNLDVRISKLEPCILPDTVKPGHTVVSKISILGFH
uniref:Uncharacterized protein n=1 Tax=Timema tahoe TaxID=61484 RepID=A0A7R9FHJ7_9NEOP|nr:unnamed protein product [Timema tahoe]